MMMLRASLAMPTHSIWITSLMFLGCNAQASGDASIIADEVARNTNHSLLWGPYRPNLYFGIRPRLPKSLTTGLLWAKVDSFQSVQSSQYHGPVGRAEWSFGGKVANLCRLDFRYTCEQHEGMAGYGWDEYDVRNGGRQTIHDAGNQIDLQTEFVKVPGGAHGGSWAVRVKGTPREDAPPDLKSTVIFSVALDGSGSLDVASGGDALGYDGTVELQGNSPELGQFSVSVTQGPKTNSHPIHNHPSYKDKPLDMTLVQSYQLPGEALWQMKGT